MKYRLRYRQHDFELAEGEFVIGRGADCQLALDDALVSRQHAKIVSRGDALTVEDMGSRNGVKVNGEHIEGPRSLREGDKIKIGGQEMRILRIKRIEAATLAQPAPTLKADAFGLLGGLADKALAMGRGEEAERILSTHLENILEDAKGGRPVAPAMAKQAATYAAKVAEASRKGRWVDYVFQLYLRLGEPCPTELVDGLYATVRKVDRVQLAVVRDYIEMLKGRSLAPSEKFLLNRVEGLERLVALK